MKLVRENLEFERGRNPKSAMGIGGVNPFREFKKDFKQLWEDTLEYFNNMIGKTITAEMEKYWMDEKHIQQTEFGEFTIKVESIYNQSIEIMNEHEQNIRPAIYFKPTDDEVNRYIYTGESNINIEG